MVVPLNRADIQRAEGHSGGIGPDDMFPVGSAIRKNRSQPIPYLIDRQQRWEIHSPMP
jgi:hypothetical protein